MSIERRMPRLSLIFIAVVALLAAGGYFAFTQAQEQPSEVLSACSSNSKLRLVDEASDCKGNEQFVQWNVQGQQGVPGPQGEPGEDAVNGLDGANGENGQDGADGQPGAAGQDGADGQDGVNGQDGQDGVDGINCWDLNGNGEEDAAENINGDGVVNVIDCGASGDEQPKYVQYLLTGTIDPHVGNFGTGSTSTVLLPQGQTLVANFVQAEVNGGCGNEPPHWLSVVLPEGVLYLTEMPYVRNAAGGSLWSYNSDAVQLVIAEGTGLGFQAQRNTGSSAGCDKTGVISVLVSGKLISATD